MPQERLDSHPRKTYSGYSFLTWLSQPEAGTCLEIRSPVQIGPGGEAHGSQR